MSKIMIIALILMIATTVILATTEILHILCSGCNLIKGQQNLLKHQTDLTIMPKIITIALIVVIAASLILAIS